MTGQILCDNPVTVVTMQPFWQHLEFALDRFIGIGDASRVRAPDDPFDQCRDLNPFLLADFKIPDDIDGCAWVR